MAITSPTKEDANQSKSLTKEETKRIFSVNRKQNMDNSLLRESVAPVDRANKDSFVSKTVPQES